MILYIHGFASCGTGKKSDSLKNYFGQDCVIAPNLPFSPKLAIKFLSNIIKNSPIDLLVGSSLGGYYAIYLAQEFNKKAVLINPSLKPHHTLLPHIGKIKRFCDGYEFVFPILLTML